MYRELTKHLNKKPLITLLIIPLIFLAVRLALVPVVWPERPPIECIYPGENRFEGCGFIFDEAHYLPAVRKMMKFNEPTNLEHPPLSKWMIMAGITLFGDNPWGWRFINVLLSSITVFLVGLLTLELSKSPRLGLIAQTLVFTDVTFFNISGFAILDPPALMLMMLVLYLYVKGFKFFSGLVL